MAYARWLPYDSCFFRAYGETLHGTYFSPTQEVVINVITDSAELLGYYREYNNEAGDRTNPDASLIFSSSMPVALETEGHIWQMRRPPDVDWYDAAIDLLYKKVLVAGVHHYGLLKSLVAGLSSLLLASAVRQGMHACAMTISGQGVMIAGAAASGKTSLFLPLLADATEVITDDWCDLCLVNDEIQAVGLEQNLSINITDLPELVQQELLPKSVMELQAIPHGYREKVILPLASICRGKIKDKLWIEKLLIICDVDSPQKAEKLSGNALNKILSSISTHMPFCNPVMSEYGEENQKRAWVALGASSTQIEMAAKVMHNRRCFCEQLSARNGKDIDIWLLPRRHNKHSLATVVNMILEGKHV